MFKHLFLDMDGVITDFDAGIRDWYDVPWYPTEWNIPYKHVFNKTVNEFWQGINYATFWSNLPWTAEGKRIVYMVEPFRPTILSAAVQDCALIGKRLWLEKNYPSIITENRFLFAGQKEAKASVAGPDKILIDDNEDTIAAWDAAGGTGILFPRPWNSLRNTPWPLEYLMSRLMIAMGGE
ncbi:MAG: hypothetical protein ACYS32_00490 [Planctomycetota bacterium]|jgi:hypothetical protein